MQITELDYKKLEFLALASIQNNTQDKFISIALDCLKQAIDQIDQLSKNINKLTDVDIIDYEFLKLTELDKVRLCAQAMEYDFYEVSLNDPRHTLRIKYKVGDKLFNYNNDSYWPFTYDIQALALAKHFKLIVDYTSCTANFISAHFPSFKSHSEVSVNNAIIDCVVKKQLYFNMYINKNKGN
ncbi:MAG: hypothetical protein ACD_33C00002G0024 [uncultured bacterium]|nr:MAG: hypothetical protein ACD_33C00002G0024 [uncultured bacterium]